MRTMKNELVNALADTIRQSVGDAVRRVAEPAIRSSIDRAISRLAAPMTRELDQLVDNASRRAADGIADKILRRRPSEKRSR